MTTSALRHLVEHAVEFRAPVLEHAFPPCFDWMRLCRDTPQMAQQATAGVFDADDLVQAHRLQEHAEAVFRTAHVVSLAVLAAANADTDDPEATLDRFDDVPEDEAEERFEVLVGEVLGPAEAFLSDPSVPLDARAVELQALYALAWPHAMEYVGRLGVVFEEEDGEQEAEEVHGVLIALARVAVLLGGLRWIADREPA